MDRQHLSVGAGQHERLAAGDARVLAARLSGARQAHVDVLDEGHRGLQHVDLDAAALARGLPLDQRAEHAIGGIHRRDVVGERRAERFGPRRIDQQAGDAAQRLSDMIEGRPRAIGAGVAEAR